MSELRDKLARLSPEKRAQFLQELTKSRKVTVCAKTTMDSLKDMGDYRCVIPTPGNFDALRFEPMAENKPGAGMVQIRAKAVSLNFRDLMIAMGMYPATPNVPSVMGSDYSGTVLACGDGVSGFKPGDKVMALSAGSLDAQGHIVADSHFNSILTVSALQTVLMPDNISFEQAAGIPTVFLTAYYALWGVARLQKGEKVLIHTATGGVGMAAMQIANWLGAEIFATAGSSEKRELLKTLGIKNPMNSRDLNFAQQILDDTDGQGVDVILNTLAGEAAIKGIEILNIFGRFLQIDKQDIFTNAQLPLKSFNKGLSYTAIDFGLFVMQPLKLKTLFQEIAEHIENGDFSPVSVRVYPVSQLSEALTEMSRSRHTGKLVLTYV
jgi:NADPH:quinone reductase-like Zn-dependent oxidoreductase